MKINITTNIELQERQGTSLALNSSIPAKDDVPTTTQVVVGTKLDVACRRENTRYKQRGSMSAHSVCVLDINNKPLTPTTPMKARKLIKGKQAKKVFSKFNTFGIKMLVETRKEIPITSLGADFGTKFEGYLIVSGKENNLNIKLDLPNKKQISDKLTERNQARRTRRNRLRLRPARFNNRARESNWLAPSQKVIVDSRLKILNQLIEIYPISICGLEDVSFNHFYKNYGSNFSTVEVGKNTIRLWFWNKNIELVEFKGYETSELRKKYGYEKTKDKSADKFSSHCCDSLTLAIEVNKKEKIEHGPMIVIDDTYRSVRRKLHDSNFSKGGIKNKNTVVKLFLA